MQPHKFTILKHIKKDSLSKDLSAIFESSLILQSPKYPEKKTVLKISFITIADVSTVQMFLVTIKSVKKSVIVGYDATSYCFIKGEDKFIVGNRYCIYGKISNKKGLYILDSFKAIQINYKELCYNLLEDL
ncbi:hypothetical protein TCON_1946 [Astathelohania contejeani]|uniref:Single-stranded DNA binding protein n=1 Tax=Astathelohania contejeani TaxID=164912 RepID=A0ABQ7HXG1_9MICR|nr:hypothetical protein TCON_1946 [Thelohania contejeani]